MMRGALMSDAATHACARHTAMRGDDMLPPYMIRPRRAFIYARRRAQRVAARADFLKERALLAQRRCKSALRR